MSVGFQNSHIVGKRVCPDSYHSQPNPRGHPARIMSPSSIKAFAQCNSRWLDGYEQKESGALSYGSIFDLMVLTPEKFNERYVIEPETYYNEKAGKDKPWNGSATVCKEWNAEMESKGLLPVALKGGGTPNNFGYEDVVAAAKRLKSDEKLGAFLSACDVQVHLTGEWHDVATGLVIPVQCLIDLVPIDSSEFASCLGDLKTTRCAAPHVWRKDSSQRGYHVQAAWNLDMWNAATGQQRDKFCFVISENVAPWQPAREMLTSEETTPGQRPKLECGRILYQGMIADYAACLKTDEWPGYDDHEDAVDGWTLDRASEWDQIEADRMLQKKSRVEPPLPY